MAAKLTAYFSNAVKQQSYKPRPKMQRGTMSGVLTETGAVSLRPEITSFGLLKVTVVLIQFTIFGGWMSKKFAALLEEYDIVRTDDDDD